MCTVCRNHNTKPSIMEKRQSSRRNRSFEKEDQVEKRRSSRRNRSFEKEEQMENFEHFEHQPNRRIFAPKTSKGIPWLASSHSVYHRDPTKPDPYKMDRRKYDRLIRKNLEMNKNLITTPEDERYHNRIRTATRDLSTVHDKHRVKDWDAMVSPTKYKAYRNCLPGFHGAPYDYRKYLPAPIEKE